MLSDSAQVRFWVRQILIAVMAQLVLLFSAGKDNFTWDDFLWGLGGAVVITVAGLLGPHEPFVGVKYRAEVPEPPAVPEPPG